MATVRSLTAEKIYAIEAATVVDAELRGDELWLIKHDGSEINVGNIRGPVGASGDHNTLINRDLGDDQHTQYLPRTGSKPMTGQLILSGDPTTNLGAATKQYVRGRGATMRVSRSVPTGGTGSYRLTYAGGTNNFLSWGGVVRDTDCLVIPEAGWYKMGFVGYFSSNPNGNVRLMSVGTDTYITGMTTPSGVSPGPLGDVFIADTVTDPKVYSSGSGSDLALLQAYGIGYVPAAGSKVAIWGRQDSGIALTCTARFSIELIRSA